MLWSFNSIIKAILFPSKSASKSLQQKTLQIHQTKLKSYTIKSETMFVRRRRSFKMKKHFCNSFGKPKNVHGFNLKFSSLFFSSFLFSSPMCIQSIIRFFYQENFVQSQLKKSEQREFPKSLVSSCPMQENRCTI